MIGAGPNILISDIRVIRGERRVCPRMVRTLTNGFLWLRSVDMWAGSNIFVGARERSFHSQYSRNSRGKEEFARE